MKRVYVGLILLGMMVASCVDQSSFGLATSTEAATTIKMDFKHRPLPEIPLPIDLATRYDNTSATGLRVNASMVAPTGFERILRRKIDQLDGWGVFQPITIPFTAPLDIESILTGHRDEDYDTSNDVFYVINVDRDSSDFGEIMPLDMGMGNYPLVLEERDNFWKFDSRGDTMSLLYEEVDEDINGNGVLDPGEDSDADGLLDRPNYLPGFNPDSNDLAGRADALMTFYERQTNTVILRLMEPLDERTTYAVVVTKRLKDLSGESVGSPFEFINHTGQNQDLEPLLDVLPDGVALDDVAFAFSYTTQSIKSNIVAVRDGLYGHGVQAHLSEDYPAVVGGLETLRDTDYFPDIKNPTILYGEDWMRILDVAGEAILGIRPGREVSNIALEDPLYADFYIEGQYQSPQLFSKVDENGAAINLSEQAWPEDLDRVEAKAVPETIRFSLSVPRKENSVRGEGKQAPIIVLGHGYQSQRFPVYNVGQFFLRRGFAVLSIDGPGHGIDVTPEDRQVAETLFDSAGYKPAAIAMLKGRATDQDFDGVPDSGADFWTSHLFHTRDVVRQFALDYMQLIRIVRSFDGERRWAYDVDGNGENELAGDFDADGTIDIGIDSPIYMTGGSLGGIMSMIMGGVEPEITAVAPMAGGGGYQDIGVRSTQRGVPEGFFLAGVLGPLYVGAIDAETGLLNVETIVGELNEALELPIASIEGAQIGDLVVVTNHQNEEQGCSFIAADGTFRLGVESDVGDPTSLVVYRGANVIPGSKCEIDGGDEVAALDQFGHDISIFGQDFVKDTPWVSVGFGLGRRRAHPDLRRTMGIGQLVLDPGDPVVYAKHLLREPLTFPGQGDTTGAHALVITTMGDMAVPASSGVTFGRAAGIIKYRENDPVFGKPMNQVLIDTHVAEAVDVLGRYHDKDGQAVHLDVENFSEGDDIWGPDYPRLETPLRIGIGTPDALGGESASIFPLSRETGRHGAGNNGEMTDRVRNQCRDACMIDGQDDPCMCNELKPYDVSIYLFNSIMGFFENDGQAVRHELCMGTNDCPDYRPAPPSRDLSTLK